MSTKNFSLIRFYISVALSYVIEMVKDAEKLYVARYGDYTVEADKNA